MYPGDYLLISIWKWAYNMNKGEQREEPDKIAKDTEKREARANEMRSELKQEGWGQRRCPRRGKKRSQVKAASDGWWEGRRGRTNLCSFSILGCPFQSLMYTFIFHFDLFYSLRLMGSKRLRKTNVIRSCLHSLVSCCEWKVQLDLQLWVLM